MGATIWGQGTGGNPLATAVNVVAAGNNQVTATQLAYDQIQRVTTVPASSGVRLPTAVPGVYGLYIHNNGANAMNLFPAAGEQINALGANNALSIPVNRGVLVFCAANLQWMAALSA